MEQHAVPQDITGFKFKLVGDMTLKQFGELAFGAIIAYLFFASNWNPLLKWPLTIFFGLLGVALAFFPIEERPLDIWIINFFRAIYRPTYYVWKKDASGLAFAVPQPSFSDTATAPMTITPPDRPEPTPIPSGPAPVLWPVPPKSEPQPTPTPQPLLSVDELTKMRDTKIKELELAQKKLREPQKAPAESGPGPTIDQLATLREQKAATQAQDSSAKLVTKEASLNSLIEQNKDLMRQIDELKIKVSTLASPDATTLQSQIDTLSSQKSEVATKITALRGEVTAQRVAPISPPEYQVSKVAPTVRVAKPKPKPATIVLTELPNVINGVIEDAAGLAIDGAILIIKDQAGNSIRALKTNKVGQFIVSTPLENGTYYLETEKANYAFDTLEVTLSGQVLAPLEIKAKPPT